MDKNTELKENKSQTSTFNGKFAACLNCIDGRIQLSILKWITENYDVDFVDMITEPGMDGFLSNPESDLEPVLKKLNIALKVHDCQEIFIVAHEDCAAHPVDFQIHENDLKVSVEKIKSFAPSCKITGIWVYLDGKIRPIAKA